MKSVLARILRRFSKNLVIAKKLPKEFGSATLYVTPRSDMRLIYLGYERSASDLMQIAEKYVRPGDCVWDIGSNLGIFSVCAAFKAGAEGNVFALEADPKYAALQGRTFNRLGKNYAKSDVLCAAVADKIGVLEFAVAKRGHARSHLVGIERDSQFESESYKQVVTITLDFLLSYWRAPHLIKIDVEGAEHLAISGAQKILNDIRPIIYIEVSHANEVQMTRTFDKVDYDIFNLNNDGSIVSVQKCGMCTVAIPKEYQSDTEIL